MIISDLQPRLLSLSQMARRLRVPAQWLRDEANAGRVPHLKCAEQLLFSPRTVESVLVDRASREGLEVQSSCD